MKNDNKLIAEFMGVNVITIDDVRENKNPYISSADGHLESDLKYHSSWDWLIPAVSKCREESNEEDSHWESVYYSLEGCDIDVTYQAVVEFIKNLN